VVWGQKKDRMWNVWMIYLLLGNYIMAHNTGSLIFRVMMKNLILDLSADMSEHWGKYASFKIKI